MDSQVSNGSGPQTTPIANLLVFSFLQSGAGHDGFQRELELLRTEVLPHAQGPQIYLKGLGPFELQGPIYLQRPEGPDDELQTDGSRFSHSPQAEEDQADSESQEEAIQAIAQHLAEIGDTMNDSIQPSLIQHLVDQFRNGNMSEGERAEQLSQALNQVIQAVPQDLSLEQRTLTLTLVLARRVAAHAPSLLGTIFRTTVHFINQNLLAYVRDLVREEMD